MGSVVGQGNSSSSGPRVRPFWRSAQGSPSGRCCWYLEQTKPLVFRLDRTHGIFLLPSWERSPALTPETSASSAGAEPTPSCPCLVQEATETFQEGLAGTTVCPPCDNELKSEAIIEHLCASEFALRMKIKEVKKENGDKKIVPKKKKPLKLGPIKKKELKKLVLYLKNGADCPCHQLDNLSHHFLIMGRKVKSQYLLTAIHKWDKKNKEFKNFMKKMKNHECPTFQSVFK
uniref:Secreted frizzled related protein 1 n=1 Tax=Ovis aries TaxID=9940 RepID=A0AC11DN11_SHEEP